jgi:hypothetical protein
MAFVEAKGMTWAKSASSGFGAGIAEGQRPSITRIESAVAALSCWLPRAAQRRKQSVGNVQAPRAIWAGKARLLPIQVTRGIGVNNVDVDDMSRLSAMGWSMLDLVPRLGMDQHNRRP